MPINNNTPARWRTDAGSDNPAGPLFGDHGAADIICETVTTSGRCGSVCTGSRTSDCC